jgi:hypothetical protein
MHDSDMVGALWDRHDNRKGAARFRDINPGDRFAMLLGENLGAARESIACGHASQRPAGRITGVDVPTRMLSTGDIKASDRYIHRLLAN